MDLTELGIGIIIGHSFIRLRRKDDSYKVTDLVVMGIAVLVIVASKYSLF
jgi:hypothetical protein